LLQVCAYEGPADSLNLAEKFFKAMGAVPKLQPRVRCLLIRATFDEKECEIRESVALVQSAVDQVCCEQ